MHSISRSSSQFFVLCVILCMISSSLAATCNMVTHSPNPIRTISERYIYPSEQAVLPYELRCTDISNLVNSTIRVSAIFPGPDHDEQAHIQLYSPTSLETTLYDVATNKVVNTIVSDSIVINRSHFYVLDQLPQLPGQSSDYYVTYRSLFKLASSIIKEPTINIKFEIVTASGIVDQRVRFNLEYVSTPAQNLTLVPTAPTIIEDNKLKYFAYPVTFNFTTSSAQSPFITLSMSDIARAAQGSDVQFIFSQQNPYCFVDGKNLPVSYNRKLPNSIDIHFPLFGTSDQFVLVDCSASVLIAAQASGFELTEPDLVVSLSTRYGLETETITSQRMEIIPV